MRLIILIPALFAAAMAILQSPTRAFIFGYLTILLMLPQGFFFGISRVIPPHSFAQAAIIPIFLVFLFQLVRSWKTTSTDWLLGIAFLLRIFIEYHHEGRGPTYNLIDRILTNMAAPYLLAKYLIHPNGQSARFANWFVLLMSINLFLSLFEEITHYNAYNKFFVWIMGQGETEQQVLERYGIVRISGSFMQPIFFCMGLGASLFLNIWLTKCKLYASHIKGRIYSLFTLFGMLLTLSRGPWMGFIMGGVFLNLGSSRHALRSLIIRTITFFILCFFTYQFYSFYASINPSTALDEAEANVAYRAKLFAAYYETLFQNFWFGGGENNWNQTNNPSSIDNHYLHFFLQYGFFTFALEIITIAYLLLRLAKKGMTSPKLDRTDRHLCFTLFAIFLAFAITFWTVFMGMQTEPLFYLFIGWIDGYLMTPSQVDSQYSIRKPKKCTV